ncbi:DUF2550 domain-containing protein [Sporichthya sp.]|uniref:DUF2550 domain-containing protein n=1 Tax=Sporichthya sp. TaxID=65475 RepID=UPI00181F9704|nr:DUF2550 domain-containing protein [Sporichthya sp.]MBA3743098.1 DUF2550 domain-containing protein [Sporichthya sp.]
MLILDIVIGLLALVGLAMLALTVRRLALQRPVGTFACSLRLGEHPDGDGWSYGIGRYHGDRVEWFPIFSLAWKPRHLLTRRRLVVRHRREPAPMETHSIPVGSVVMVCSLGEDSLELAMSHGALTGFLSWAESAPPKDPMVA